jgi:hypothetical protein
MPQRMPSEVSRNPGCRYRWLQLSAKARPASMVASPFLSGEQQLGHTPNRQFRDTGIATSKVCIRNTTICFVAAIMPMFLRYQFGGSTHCLVFKKGAISQFAAQAIPQGPNGTNSTVVKVNSLLGIATP